MIGGEYEETTPAITEALYHGISNCRLVVFGNGSHLTHLEQPDACCSVVSRFLAEVNMTVDL